MDSILKRGIANSNITNVMKITKELEIDTESLASGEIKPALIRVGHDSYMYANLKPGINVVHVNKDNIESFDVSTTIMNIVNDIINLPPERQEIIYDMVELQKKRNKPIVFVQNPHSRKPSPYANAAHARTDLDVPEGTDTSDNDIMDDDNF